MDSKKLVSITAIVFLLTLIAVALVSDTYAKYTTTVDGSDTAIVAKWDVSDGDAFEQIDLFDASKIYDTNGVTDYTAAGVNDTDVKDATTGADGIVAPGTWGKFSYTLSNNSDVNAVYSVSYTANEAGVPLEWSNDGTTWQTDIASLNSNTKTIAMGTTNETVTLYWRWVFAGNDTTDTTLGEAGTAKPTVDLAVTFTQAD